MVRGGETETIVPYIKIGEILKNRRRKILAVILSPFFIFPFVLLLFAGNILIRYPEPVITKDAIDVMFVLIFFLMFGLIMLMGMHITGGFSKIVLINQREEPSFWKVKKYDMVVETFKLLGAFALGFAAAYLIFYFKLK